MAYLKRQPFPKELIPPSSHEKRELAEGQHAKRRSKKGREISFGDFTEVAEVPTPGATRTWASCSASASRMSAAAEAYARAWKAVGRPLRVHQQQVRADLARAPSLRRGRESARRQPSPAPWLGQHQRAPGAHSAAREVWAKAKTSYLEALGVNPFDPEVHVALYAAAEATNDATLKARSLEAAKLLLHVEPQMMPELARRFASADDLANLDVGLGLHAAQADGGARAPR